MNYISGHPSVDAAKAGGVVVMEYMLAVCTLLTCNCSRGCSLCLWGFVLEGKSIQPVGLSFLVGE